MRRSGQPAAAFPGGREPPQPSSRTPRARVDLSGTGARFRAGEPRPDRTVPRLPWRNPRPDQPEEARVGRRAPESPARCTVTRCAAPAASAVTTAGHAHSPLDSPEQVSGKIQPTRKYFGTDRGAPESAIIPAPARRFAAAVHPGRKQPFRPEGPRELHGGDSCGKTSGATQPLPNSATKPSVCHPGHLNGTKPGVESDFPSKVPSIPRNSTCTLQFEDQGNSTPLRERSIRGREPLRAATTDHSSCHGFHPTGPVPRAPTGESRPRKRGNPGTIARAEDRFAINARRRPDFPGNLHRTVPDPSTTATGRGKTEGIHTINTICQINARSRGLDLNPDTCRICQSLRASNRSRNCQDRRP